MPRGHHTLYTDLMMTDKYDTQDPYRNFQPGFGVRLRDVRDELGLSRRRAAKLIGCSHTHILRLEAETRGTTVAFMQAAAKAYGVNWRWLAFGDPPKRGAGGQGHGHGPVFPRLPRGPVPRRAEPLSPDTDSKRRRGKRGA